MSERTQVVVIGGGQAGLSAAHHLQRIGTIEHIVLDAAERPGGAWLHRWDSLTMGTVNRIFDLPGMERPEVPASTPANLAVPAYFADYESRAGLTIRRPWRALRVERADADPRGELVVSTDHGQIRTRAIINATGTWDHPILPHYPGHERFTGRHMHTRDYRGAHELAQLSVGIIGGGISALQHLDEVSAVARTAWYTRRPVEFDREGFRPEVEGVRTIERVTADVRAGNPTGSVVSYTGLAWTDYVQRAHDRGALVRRPMFTEVLPHGVREADGSVTTLDVLLWATGFTPAIAHLDPLGLRNDRGGIQLEATPSLETQVAGEPRVHLIGFGPSQSTIGANRAGGRAARALRRYLRDGG